MDFPAVFAGIATQISAAFGGPFYDARILSTTAPVTDEGGSIITPGEPVLRPCSAQVDACTEAMRSADGYAAKDVRILVLSATLEGDIDSDMQIEMLAGQNVGVFSIQSVDRDPMSAYHELRARPV